MTTTTRIESYPEGAQYVQRAIAALYRRPIDGNGVPSQPSSAGSACVKLIREKDGKVEWERLYVVLTNVGGILGCYRVQILKDGTDRLKWIERIPSEIVAEFGA